MSPAIGVESDAASYDTHKDVDRGGEQVGRSGTIPNLWLGVNIVSEPRLVMSTDTWLMIVGVNNAKAYRGPLVPAYINTKMKIFVKKVRNDRKITYSRDKSSSRISSARCASSRISPRPRCIGNHSGVYE